MNDNNIKVTFSKEFEEKTKYHKLSRKKVAKLREKKFQSITEKQLSQVHTMSELVRLLGLSATNSSHRKYAKKLIRDKRILEYPTGEKRGLAIIYDYCFPASDPRSKIGLKENKLISTAKEDKISQVVEKTVKKIESVAEKITTKITITCNSVNITLEDPTPEVLETILNKVPFQN